MSPESQNRLAEIYNSYNNSVKLLIADLEARTQAFPIEIFNEIRAFADHIARCYLSGKTADEINEELDKAEGHLVRITLDCYKHLNVHFFDSVATFEKKDMKYVDLSYVDNGAFVTKLRSLKLEAKNFSREARKCESQNKEESLRHYESMYLKYNEIEHYIETNSVKLIWARQRFRKNFWIALLVWVVPIILSGVISWYVAVFYERSKISKENITEVQTTILPVLKDSIS